MHYRLSPQIALRKWKYVDRAIYVRGREHALGASKEEFALLLLCDGHHDLEESPLLLNLEQRGYINKCQEGEEPTEWSKFKEYPNMYFPKMNLMITGRCNLNCLHCFNAADNAPLNTEWDYDKLLNLLDQAKEVGVHAFTITGGEPMVHPRFMDIMKAIYERDMFVFELNTNGFLITQEILDEFKTFGCRPLIKISYDGVGYHNWIRQNPNAEARTIEAIKLCVKNGFNVKAQTQVHAKNYDTLMETAKLLDSIGVSEIRFIRTTEAPRWEKNSPQTSIPIAEYFGKMLVFAKEYVNSGLQMDIDIWQYITIYPSHHTYYLTPVGCEAKDYSFRMPLCRGTRGMIGVSSSGEVVPCLQMSGWLIERGISMGNVHKNTLKELLDNSDYLTYATAMLLHKIINNDKCASCKYFKVCNGGCPALGLLYSQEHFNYYHEDITKCYFFENGWYEKTVSEMGDWKNGRPMELD